MTDRCVLVPIAVALVAGAAFLPTAAAHEQHAAKHYDLSSAGPLQVGLGDEGTGFCGPNGVCNFGLHWTDDELAGVHAPRDDGTLPVSVLLDDSTGDPVWAKVCTIPEAQIEDQHPIRGWTGLCADDHVDDVFCGSSRAVEVDLDRSEHFVVVGGPARHLASATGQFSPATCPADTLGMTSGVGVLSVH